MADHAEKDGHTPPGSHTVSTDEKSDYDNSPALAITASNGPTKKGRFDKTFHEEAKANHALVDMSQIELRAEDLYDKEKVRAEMRGTFGRSAKVTMVTFAGRHRTSRTRRRLEAAPVRDLPFPRPSSVGKAVC